MNAVLGVFVLLLGGFGLGLSLWYPQHIPSNKWDVGERATGFAICGLIWLIVCVCFAGDMINK